MQKQKGMPLRAFAIFLLAAIIGVTGGLLGVGFQKGLDAIQTLLTGREWIPDTAHPGKLRLESLPEAVRAHLTWWQTLLVPTAGGLVAGIVLLLVRGKKPPFGIADLVVLVQLRKGTIRLRESLVQIVSSACTIGSGGSIGREGANSQIAATVAALIARWAQLGSRPRAVLLGCGVAAGMATSYNAPIAGAMFVMEAVLGNFAMDVFAPIVVASVLATMTALLLGVMCGFGGLVLRHSLDFSRRLFLRLRLNTPLTLALGGLAVGCIGLYLPETWGNGFEVIKKYAEGPTAALIVTLFLGKLVATCATIGSGGLGGIFTPNLVIGAAFGALFAFGLHWFTGEATPETAKVETQIFAFVGMAGLTAATMHAPVTSVVLVFELTRHYELTLPVMLCSIVASITASLLDEDSYYTAAIKQKGEELPGGIEDMAIRTTFVRDVLRKDVVTVRDTAGFSEVMQLLGSHRGDTIYVQNVVGALVGRIELQDVKNFLNDPALTSAVIAADLTRPVVTAGPDESIAAVMPYFDDPELREIAVVSPGNPPRLQGRVRHQDVITTLGSEVLGQQRRNTRLSLKGTDADDLKLPQGYELRTLPVPDAWVGLAIDALPPESLRGLVVLMAIRSENGRDQHVAGTPDLVLLEGWRVVVLGTAESIARLQRDGDPDEE
jgi:CIC family chloride channel protein